jgi:3-oxoacyl-[acyl-carrier protein] reductase
MLTIDLTGKTAVVTGASQGLGEATARMLHAAGSCVVVNYVDDSLGENRQRAEQLVQELGDRSLAVAADVRDVVAVDAMRNAVQEKFGRLDILVNNAGIIRDHTMKKMNGDDWQAVVDTNLTGVFQVCQSMMTLMEQGGRIINLASISAVIGFFGQANYAAAKAGVIGLTRVLSKELAGRKITVNAVAPGVVLTPMGQSIPDHAQEKMLEQIPLGRFGEPQDIAHAITFLSSDFASYITGQTIHVNGGWWG